MGILPLVKDVSALCEWSNWYLDEAVLCGSDQQLGEALSYIQSKKEEYGLALNLKKCQLWSPLPEVKATQLSGVPRVSSLEGVRILGTPVGSSTYIDSFIEKCSQNLDEVLKLLPGIGCSRTSFLLLKFCLSACKVTHLLRSLPFLKGAKLAQLASSLIRQAVGLVVGIPLSELQWELARLPIREGGLGLLDPLAIHPPAFISAFCSSKLISFDLGLPCLSPPSDFNLAVDWLQVISPSMVHTVSCIPSSRITASDETSVGRFLNWKAQHFWSELAVRFMVEDFDSKAPARMASFRSLCASPHAGDWILATPPSGDEKSLSSREWQFLLRWRLCIPFDQGCACPVGKSRTLMVIMPWLVFQWGSIVVIIMFEMHCCKNVRVQESPVTQTEPRCQNLEIALRISS